MKKLDHPGIPERPSRPRRLTDEGYSHQAFNTFNSSLLPSFTPPLERTHAHPRTRASSQYSIQAVRQMDRLQTRTGSTSKRRSGRAAGREERKGAHWFTRETGMRERERGRLNLSPPPLKLRPPCPPFQNKYTCLIKREREMPLPAVFGLHLLPPTFYLGPFKACLPLCTLVRKRAQPLHMVGEEVGWRRVGGGVLGEGW